MSASVTNDKLTQSMNGGNPVATTVSSARSIGGTSLSCVSLTNWPTATAVYFVTYQKKTDGTVDTTTLCSWKGVVSGTTIGSLTLENGTDAGNAQGDYVEMGPTAAWAEGIYDWGTTIHNTDGTLKDGIIATAKIADSAITTAKIADSAVTTAKIADGTITAPKIDWTTLSARKTVDANGWTVYDMGGWKEYRITSTQPSINIAASDRSAFTSFNLPVGVANLTGLCVTTSIRSSAYPGNFFLGIVGSPSSTVISGFIGNNYPGATLATGTFYIDACLKTL